MKNSACFFVKYIKYFLLINCIVSSRNMLWRYDEKLKAIFEEEIEKRYRNTE